MKNVCATGAIQNGYDVSHYQSTHVHAMMKTRGDVFCLIKADEGARIVDTLFKAHWAAAKAAGMITGAYNFFHPSQDPIAQARHMESIIGKLGPGDLGPVIDWETTDGVPSITDREEGLAFLTDVEKATGKTPIIYGAPYFLNALNLDNRFSRFTLWIAHYGAKCPLIPLPWQNWGMWQYTDSGGIDLDFFNGSLDQLRSQAGVPGAKA